MTSWAEAASAISADAASVSILFIIVCVLGFVLVWVFVSTIVPAVKAAQEEVERLKTEQH